MTYNWTNELNELATSFLSAEPADGASSPGAEAGRRF